MYENIVGCECKIHGLTAIACSECLQDSLSNRSRLTAALDSERKRAEGLEKERDEWKSICSDMEKVKDKAFLVARDADGSQRVAFEMLTRAKAEIERLMGLGPQNADLMVRLHDEKAAREKAEAANKPLLDELEMLRKENKGLKRARQGLGD